MTPDQVQEAALKSAMSRANRMGVSSTDAVRIITEYEATRATLSAPAGAAPTLYARRADVADLEHANGRNVWAESATAWQDGCTDEGLMPLYATPAAAAAAPSDLLAALVDLEAMAERYRPPGYPYPDAQKRARAAIAAAGNPSRGQGGSS